jgi:hypothetical protein
MPLIDSTAGQPASIPQPDSRPEEASSVPFLVISGLALILSIAVVSMSTIGGTGDLGTRVTETRKPAETGSPRPGADAVIPRQGG